MGHTGRILLEFEKALSMGLRIYPRSSKLSLYEHPIEPRPIPNWPDFSASKSIRKKKPE
jgi:hypothetical protein